MKSIRRILVPVDFSPATAAAVEWAGEIAVTFGAGVDILHVWDPPRGAAEASSAPGGHVPPLVAEFARTYAGDRMRGYLAALEARGVAPVRGMLERGDPQRAIEQAAATDAYDLVVMGMHGRGRFAGRLLGGVAVSGLTRGGCPVLTCPAPPTRRVAPPSERGAPAGR